MSKIVRSIVQGVPPAPTAMRCPANPNPGQTIMNGIALNGSSVPLNSSLNDPMGACTIRRLSTFQDGIEHLPIPWDEFDAVFLGGSTTWKLGPAAAHLAAEARQRGLPVHLGRVNSLRRLHHAALIGATSVDGTLLAFGPDRHLPRLLRWLHQIQPTPTAAVAPAGPGGPM